MRPMGPEVYVSIGAVFVILIFIGVLLRLSCKGAKETTRRANNNRSRGRLEFVDCSQPQDQNVFNISSRVQGQEQRHPDAFVSLEHITIMNELNKPPKYDDAPPSYEEAIKIAMAQDNSLKTFQTEVAASQGTSSSSSAAATSSAATPQIQPAIPNRTE
ncbi:uncharacterized protein LOC143201430 isoform X2 [Rhynchophorus ferrugineus]|uniref:uncharacterized protein LOC143201430 isoform X2 n=1 Tax=Rhynchophorus ferrugineus TaxID=354439 RepID=UPI003FCC6E66